MKKLSQPILRITLAVAFIGGLAWCSNQIRQRVQDSNLRPYDEISRRKFDPMVAMNRGLEPIVEIPVRNVNDVHEDDVELAPNFLVLGVTVNGQSRAYPLNQLVNPEREIFNDMLGGRAIMPTW